MQNLSQAKISETHHQRGMGSVRDATEGWPRVWLPRRAGISRTLVCRVLEALA